MSSEEARELIEVVKEDADVQKESMRALTLYKKADYKTKEAIGEQIIVERSVLMNTIETAVDTISRVATERDHYKEILGEVANQDVVQDALANKLVRQNKNARNKIAMQEIRQTIELGKALCNQSQCRRVVVSLDKTK